MSCSPNTLYDPSPDHTGEEQQLIGNGLETLMISELDQQVALFKELPDYIDTGACADPKDVILDRVRRQFLARWKNIDRLRRRYIVDPIDLDFLLARLDDEST